MNKKGQLANVGMVFVAGIAVLLFGFLLFKMANSLPSMGTLTSVSNENLTSPVIGTPVTLAITDTTTCTRLQNSTGSQLTLNTDYTCTTKGIFDCLSNSCNGTWNLLNYTGYASNPTTTTFANIRSNNESAIDLASVVMVLLAATAIISFVGLAFAMFR